jgi:hypothetical protein
MQTRPIETTLYWAFAGSLMGYGLLGGFGVGIPLMLFGIFFLSFGLARIERRGVWAALFGFGAIPTGLLLYNSGSDVNLGVLIFGVIALTGAIWGLIEIVKQRNYTR